MLKIMTIKDVKSLIESMIDDNNKIKSRLPAILSNDGIIILKLFENLIKLNILLDTQKNIDSLILVKLDNSFIVI